MDKLLSLYTLIALILSTIPSITSQEHDHFDELLSDTIFVDPSGPQGTFRTIQAAIDSIPPNNQKWITVSIKAGTYKEQVLIPREKPFIYVKGAGKRNTFVVWNASDDISMAATFASEADDTLAKGITFVNSYNAERKTPIARALAARIHGDKSAFLRCGFHSLQDTLWDAAGRHYYQRCTITGSVDFIFGAGQTHYEGCTIGVDTRYVNGPGYITAQGRGTPQDTNGFVFKQCKIVGAGQAFLGRPWRDYSRVLFYDTFMSDIVVPEGWNIWDKAGKESQLTLSEYNCTGPGSSRSGRVKWEKNLSEDEVNKLTSTSFIDSDGWLQKALTILGA